jgi:hypothetical protein
VATIDWTGFIREYLRGMPGSPGPQSSLDAQGELLEKIGSGVQAYIENYIDRRLDVASYSEAYVSPIRSYPFGNGPTQIFLRNDFIVALTALTANGTNVLTVGDETAWPLPQAVVNPTRDGIMMTGGLSFAPGGHYAIAYSAGYLPDDPERMALIRGGVHFGALIYRRRERIGITSENINGIQTNFTDDPPKWFKETLDGARRVTHGAFA